MSMTPKFKQQLKAKAHPLKPVVLIGSNGITEPVLAEIDRALTAHELIKVRLPSIEREEKQEALSMICEKTQAELVQIIGNIGVLYRKSEE